MKKVSKFYLSKQRKLKDLVKQMEDMAIEDQRKKLKKIVSDRREKWKDNTILSQLQLPNFNHLKKHYMEFSIIPPNASKQPFITQKDKIKVVTSNRAYSSNPNLKAGTLQHTAISYNDIPHPQILNPMFLEYDRLIDLHSPGPRIKALKKVGKQLELPKCHPKKVCQNFGKTYFQKFTTHRFNIDKTNDYHSITEVMTRRCITDRATIAKQQLEDLLIQPKSINRYMQTRSPSAKQKFIEGKKLQRLYSTFESTSNEENESFGCGIFNQSRNKKADIGERNSPSKKSIYSKSRVKLYKMKNSRGSQTKNINSVEF